MRKDKARVRDVGVERRGEGRESGAGHSLETDELWKEGRGFLLDWGAAGTLSSMGPRREKTWVVNS